jgi:hypothetical protein
MITDVMVGGAYETNAVAAGDSGDSWPSTLTLHLWLVPVPGAVLHTILPSPLIVFRIVTEQPIATYVRPSVPPYVAVTTGVYEELDVWYVSPATTTLGAAIVPKLFPSIMTSSPPRVSNEEVVASFMSDTTPKELMMRVIETSFTSDTITVAVAV